MVQIYTCVNSRSRLALAQMKQCLSIVTEPRRGGIDPSFEREPVLFPKVKKY